MAERSSDFLKDYQAFAQQSWDAWARQWQALAVPPSVQAPLAASADEGMERSLAGLKSYFEWLQHALSGGVGQGAGDWREQLGQLFAAPGAGGPGAAFAQSFAAQAGFGGLPFQAEPMPAFGYTREQQEAWQALAAAFADYADTCQRYQALLLKAHIQGVERLQGKLEEHIEPGRQVDSLKSLYDLWVDAAEEAYAGVADTEEFRAAYGAMVDAQMRLRQQQQAQVEQWSRELGMPTRSEVNTLGRRLQELRRECRAADAERRAQARELAALRDELAKVAARPDGRPAVKKAAAARKAATVKSTAGRAGGRSRKHS